MVRKKLVVNFNEDFIFYDGISNGEYDVDIWVKPGIKIMFNHMIIDRLVKIVIISPNMTIMTWVDWVKGTSLREHAQGSIGQKDEVERYGSIDIIKVDEQNIVIYYDDVFLSNMVKSNLSINDVYSCYIDYQYARPISCSNSDIFLTDVHGIIERDYELRPKLYE